MPIPGTCRSSPSTGRAGETEPAVAAQKVEKETRRAAGPPGQHLAAGRRPGRGDPARTIAVLRVRVGSGWTVRPNSTARSGRYSTSHRSRCTSPNTGSLPVGCYCGKTTTGTAPAYGKAPVQYGPVMCAVIIYLFMGQFLSKEVLPRQSGSCSASPSPPGPSRP